MDRETVEGDPVRWTDDDDATRRLGAARPRGKRSRGDRAGIHDAGVRRDHDLWRDAAIGPGALAHIRDHRAQGFRLRRIEHPCHLRGMNRLSLIKHEAASHSIKPSCALPTERATPP